MSSHLSLTGLPEFAGCELVTGAEMTLCSLNSEFPKATALCSLIQDAICTSWSLCAIANQILNHLE